MRSTRITLTPSQAALLRRLCKPPTYDPLDPGGQRTAVAHAMLHAREQRALKVTALS
jgi:hypothetical protein